ncbi:DUF1127 domain-containing protein [Bradyrhizobium sp.]|uniref:DUF1127 domain-containing protein n=1 Tax=Bradyrhizobium sp. TaxID=376 RepID=UPI003C755175
MKTVMIKKWAARLASRSGAIAASLLMRWAVRQLLGLDERSLVDVGLSRADVTDCLSTPFTTDPTGLLTARSRRRRMVRPARPAGAGGDNSPSLKGSQP